MLFDTAGHLNVGQSAMSSSLGRLRKLLGDELLTRAPDGMRLTPRAVALVEPVRSAVRQFQCIVLREDSFDPAMVERGFTLAVPGSVEAYLIPRLLALLRREAPGISLRLRALDYGSVLGELDADKVDLAVGVLTEGQAHHKVRALYRFGYLCLFNPELLGVAPPLSLDDYLRFPHIMTSITGADHGVVDINRRTKVKASPSSFTPQRPDPPAVPNRSGTALILHS